MGQRLPVRTAAIRAALGLLLAGTLIACSSVGAEKRGFDASLREEVHRVPVAGAGANIVVTSFRPPGAGPFPWIIHSHGTALTSAANRAIGRNRNPALAREWVRRGYAVLVPVRRGYGASGGATLGDAHGGCSNPDFRRAGDGAALDLLATIAPRITVSVWTAAVAGFFRSQGIALPF